MSESAGLLSEGFVLLAGEDQLRAQREAEAALMRSGLSLSQAQEREQSGRIGIHLVRSMYGWSVRYASGLQNFGLIRPSRLPEHMGPREHAEELADYLQARDYAIEWSADNRGYAYVSRSELQRYGISEAEATGRSG